MWHLASALRSLDIVRDRFLSISINYRVKTIITRTARSDSGAKLADRALSCFVRGDARRSFTKISSTGSATHSFCLITINYGLPRPVFVTGKSYEFQRWAGTWHPPCSLACLMRAIKSPSPMDTGKEINETRNRTKVNKLKKERKRVRKRDWEYRGTWNTMEERANKAKRDWERKKKEG
mgnify:CR=1 FL=1